MPLDAISATLLTTAALMFVALIRRVKMGLWPRARREIRRHWLGSGRVGAGPTTSSLPPALQQAANLLKRAAPGASVRARVSVGRLIKARQGSDRTSDLEAARGFSADLVVVDPESKKRFVVLLETAGMSERRRSRLEQTRELLFIHGVALSVWRDSERPTVASVRQQLSAAGLVCVPTETSKRPSPSRRFGVQTQPSTLL